MEEVAVAGPVKRGVVENFGIGTGVTIGIGVDGWQKSCDDSDPDSEFDPDKAVTDTARRHGVAWQGCTAGGRGFASR